MEKTEKMIGKKDEIKQSELNPISEYSLSTGTRNECYTIDMKEETNESVDRLLLRFVNQLVIPTF